MNKVVKTLRIVLPILMVAFIALLLLSFRGGKIKPPAPAEPVEPSPIRPRDRVKVAMEAFDDVQTLGGRVVSRIRAKKTLGLASGWYTLEGVQLTIYRKNGQTFDVFCDQAEFNAKTKEAQVKGGVRVVSSDGVELSTDAVKFDGRQLTNRIPVNFKINRWTGRAGGLDLDVETETLRLVESVTASLAPSRPGEEPVLLEAAGAAFDRARGAATFGGNVTVRRPNEILRSDNVTLTVDQTRNVLTSLAGTGNIIVRLLRGSGLMSARNDEILGGGETRITADTFVGALNGDGDLIGVDILGERVPAHAIFDGLPRRELSAKTFKLFFADKYVSQMQALGDAVLQELGPQPRVMEAARLTVAFDPATRKASSALIEENVRYRDPKNQARGARAIYDIAGDRVTLTETAGAAPTVISDGQTLKANRIEFSPKEGSMRAVGNVVARLNPKKGSASASDTSLFPKGEAPVFVNADNLIGRQANKVAHFTGNVKAWQETNSLFAAELQITGAGDVIQAKGGVRTILYNSRPGAAPTPMTSRSETLTARKADQKIDLQGGVDIEDQGRKLTSQEATFFFDAKRKLDRIETAGNVVMTEAATGRKATAEKGVYRVNTRMVYLDGKPVVVTDANGTVKGSQIVFDLNRNKFEVIRGETQTEGTYNPR